MDTIVQKYGGTSVNSKERRSAIIRNAREVIDEGAFPVIVVSAMGRLPDPYATDSLISIVSHVEVSPRSKDLISSLGEIITTVLVAEELTAAGLKAFPLTGGQAGIRTDENFGSGNILDIDTDRILALIDSGFVPVVAGFQGSSAAGEILTLGRGGSDITATALGSALKSRQVEIFTDVDGVMTADPNVVSDASLITSIDYENVFRLAEYGAKVLHPRAVDHAMRSGVPIVVLNVAKSRTESHTRIAQAGDLPRGRQAFTAVTSKGKVSQVILSPSSMQKEDEVFTAIAEGGISIDMINILADHKQFIIDTQHNAKMAMICEKAGVPVKITEGFAKITVLGNYIAGRPGIFAKIIAALYGAQIPVYQSSDSSITIAVLISEDKEKEAVRLLHDAMGGDEDRTL